MKAAENQCSNVSLSEFLDAVIGGVEEGTHILGFIQPAGKSPGFPRSIQEIQQSIDRSERHAPCGYYFSTATARRNDDGELRNRDELFDAQFCIVLDDIGTGPGAKCRPEDLPEALRNPTWIVESSPGNLQFGYALEHPIEDLGVAKAFTSLMFKAGSWDSGGALPNKAVRLPFGYNVKAKYGDTPPPVTLQHWAPERLWTADELLAAVDSPTSWEEIQADAKTALRRDPLRSAGTAVFLDEDPPQLNGLIDPVLEVLHENNFVMNQGAEWWDIVCPWGDEHNGGKGAAFGTEESCAGYSPLGAGKRPFQRAFHCFHDSCSERTTHDFLAWVADQTGVQAAVVDGVAPLAARWALDAQAAEWVDIQSPDLYRLPDKGFRLREADYVIFITGVNKDGEILTRGAEAYSLIRRWRYRLKVDGVRFVPGGELIVRDGDRRLLNECSLPVYPASAEGDVEWFADFIRYLIPKERDAEWFLDHLAKKVQDPTYRGNPVIMHTPTTGTGRGTLFRILSGLFGEHNTGDPSMSQFLAGVQCEGFNEFLRRLVLVIPEARERPIDGESSSVHNLARYEALKQFCEPTPVSHRFKRKYGKEWSEMAYSMVIICSNHSDALRRDANDRRFREIENTRECRGADYFTFLYKRLDGGKWKAPLWNWLKARDTSGLVVGENLALLDDAERLDSILQGGTDIDRMVHFTLEYAKEKMAGCVLIGPMTDAIEATAVELRLDEDMRQWRKVFARELRARSKATAERRSVLDKQVRVRVISETNKVPDGTFLDEALGDLAEFASKAIADLMS